LLNVKLVVHHVTSRLQKVNMGAVSAPEILPNPPA